MSLRIDVVSDYVCPWCFIGHTRLARVLRDHPDLEVEIVPQPYLLDPAVPDAGYDLHAHLREKFGPSASNMFGRVEEAARAEGIEVDFSSISRYPNTLSAHVLTGLASEYGKQHLALERLFEAYFVRGLDISRDDVLLEVAVALGLSESETLDRLRDDEARHSVRTRADAFRRQGISGVPFFIFDSRLAVQGAQPDEVFAKVLRRALEPA